MITLLLLHKSNLVLDENFDSAINLSGRWVRVDSEITPKEDVIKNIEKIDTVICWSNIRNDNGTVESYILKAKETKTNLVCIAEKEDFENLIQYRKEWFLSNSNDVKIITQLGSKKVELENYNFIQI